ncbi:MAG: PAS domain S-box protein [Deltaproteobacteria bacterium]|nr:PAS domain S-box protein [Deltaproteobacteria bacterium]
MSTKVSHKELKDRVRELEQEALQRRRTEEELRESSRRLRVAYEQSIVYAQHLNEEIAERKRMEEALQESEERFRTVADFSYDWEYWIGPDGGAVYVSPSCERITGYRQDEFHENPGLIEKISHPEDRKLIAGHLKLEMESKEGLSMDFRIITHSGEERWIAHVCQPVYGAEGNLLGRRATNRDITKRKRAEEEREKLVQELQDALAEVKALSGLLPICASCKKIRDDQGYWTQLEAYIRDHSEAEFSHSICPECREKLYGKS